MSTHKMVLNESQITGWRMGFSNFLWKENGRWWKTRLWVIQILVFLFLVNGTTIAMLMTEPEKEFNLIIFFLNAGIFPAIAITIVMQDALIEEKRSGTAAWVLSKPISRAAFLLAKWIANSFGIFITAVVTQGLIAYALFRTIPAWTVQPLDMALGMAVVTLFLLFSLTLTLMLGTFFQGRGPVIGISLLALLAQYYLLNVPILRLFLPGALIFPVGQEMNQIPSLAAQLALGQSISTWVPIGMAVLFIPVFFAITLWRFKKEEF